MRLRPASEQVFCLHGCEVADSPGSGLFMRQKNPAGQVYFMRQ